ncbi:MAG: T9SS type A sorting domain-containing protein [Saprospiraceae bacterium]|nr:T9SS type A sorting domain-containing protein [Saprospiraceae bacterium]
MIKIVILSIIFLNCSYGQVKTILDSLDDPIALTFVGDNVYLALHGRKPNTGKLVSFNINNPKESYLELFDSLTYPRAIIVKDDIIYLGLRDEIVMYKLNTSNKIFDTLIHKTFLFPSSFTFNGDDLIYTHQNAISKINISNLNPESVLIDVLTERPLSITNYDKSIYVATGTSIHRYNLEDNYISVIIKDLEYNIYSILIRDDFIYLDQSDLSGTGEEILVYNLKNLESGAQSFCKDLSNVISLAEYEDKIYFANQRPVNGKPEGKILMLEKNLVRQPVENTIHIYPNPTSNSLTIETLYINDIEFYLYNSNGTFISHFSNTGNLEMQNFPAGIYLLKYINNKIAGTKKIIKVNE